MDLRQYFRKIREIEAVLIEPYPLLVSLETSDGGKAGTFCESSRANAARMIAEGRAVLATPEQVEEFRTQQATARKAAEKAEMAKRIQVAIVTEPDFAGSGTNPRGGCIPGGK